uniref:(northern house mosquito) hypothetical protein n=1 Tax=Culex pipiens TaxID=7175 RepID=A0A8D8PAT4_CULPI
MLLQSLGGKTNQNKHGGIARDQIRRGFQLRGTQQLAKPARSCLFPSRERERQPHRAQPEIDRWTLTSLPGTPSNQPRFPPCTTHHHPYKKTSTVRKPGCDVSLTITITNPCFLFTKPSFPQQQQRQQPSTPFLELY